jgi:hypothetical protein
VALGQTLNVLNQMAADGIIETYAIGGAVAAFYYVEASSTDDLDILVSFGLRELRSSGLITLKPISDYLAAKGYREWKAEGLVIEGWPVQFLPVADALDAEALESAPSIDLEVTVNGSTVPVRILTAEHVVANAVKVGRSKDINRIAQFLEEGAFDYDRLCDILSRHALRAQWEAISVRLGVENRCQ